jgi:hypothetical protein
LRARFGAVTGLGLVAIFAGCQVIAGLEDRTLGEATGVAGSSGAGGGASGTGGGSGAGGASGSGGKAGASGKGGGGTGGASGAAGAAGSTNGCMPAAMDGGVMPAPPPGDAGTTGTTTLVFAARRYFLGTVVPSNDPTKQTPDFTAWRDIGYDLDGLCTAIDGGALSMGSCVPAGSATSDLITDGKDCRDNAFGRFIAEKLGPLAPEKVTNDKIDQGAPTFILKLEDVSAGPCNPHVPGKLYVTTPEPGSPWMTADPRKIDGRTVCGGSLDVPKMSFPKGYMVGDRWVSGPVPAAAMTTFFPLGDNVLKLHAKTVVLTADLSPDHQSIVSSTFEAVFDPKEVLAEFKPIALGVNGCVDPGAIVSTYVDGMLLYSDLADVPGFSSPGKPCTLMSFAIGLLWTPVKPPIVVVPTLDAPLPCDGGIPGSAGSGGASGSSGAAGSSGASGAGGAPVEEGCPAMAGASGSAGVGGTAGAGGVSGNGGKGGKGGVAGNGGAGG